MRELDTIQKRNNLNLVFATDEPGKGGANHEYRIWVITNPDPVSPEVDICDITFQNGARFDETAIHGIIDSDLLEIVRDRLRGFQSGEFATRENAIALTHIEEALLWLNKRVDDRAARGTLGTYKK